MENKTITSVDSETGTPCCFVGNIGHDGPCKNISFQKDTISKNGTVATEDAPKKLTRIETQALADYVIGATRHPLDDPAQAADIVTFWKRGTASSVETKIIETYLAVDTGLKNRFRVMFPALAQALKNAGYS